MKKKRFSLKMPAGYNRPIHAAVLLLNFFGVLMVISGSMSSKSSNGFLLFTGFKEMMFLIVSYVFMVLFARYFTFDFFKKYYRILLIGLFGSLLVTLAFGEINGAYAWIQLGPFTLQPSEFAKVFVILMIALKFGDKQRTRIKSLWDFIKSPLITVILIVGIIVVLQKDLGSAVVLLGISYICFLVPSNRKLTRLHQFMIALLFIAIVTLIYIDTPGGLAFLESLGIPPYMLERFRSAANPFANRYDGSYQLFMGLVAMRQGIQTGFFGKGYGNSTNKYGYLPEAQTDFILAIIVEELGVFGILIVLIGYGMILFNIFKYSLLVRLERDKILLVGASAYIMIHFVFNIGGVTGLIPLTGVPLLFLSAGGSSKMAIMIAIGLVQNVISRYNIEQKVIAEKKRRMEASAS